MKCVATAPLFAETFNKEVFYVLCEKPIILVELLFELRMGPLQLGSRDHNFPKNLLYYGL